LRIRTHLQRIRTARGLSVRDVYAATGIAIGDVSRIEHGQQIPRDDQVEQMIGVYGHPADWYPPTVLRVLQLDEPDCGGCGDRLTPDSLRRQKFHDEACRREARNRARRKTPVGVLSAPQT
jgi:transcriptional regulator with XRE-family HTH domain